MAEDPSSHITPEQLQIIELVAKGWTDQRIANHLGISLSTVQRRLRAAAEIFNARSRVGVAMRAAARNLIRTEDDPSSIDHEELAVQEEDDE